MKKIVFAKLPTGEMDLIRPLWEKIKNHHVQKTVHFREYFEKKTWADRKKDLFGANNELKIIVTREKNDGAACARIIGYCIASITDKSRGEIDSIYIEEEYRGCDYGSRLMEESLAWFRDNGITDIVISVAVGNEEVLKFYEKFGFKPRLYVLERC
ncbi:MAG TPA: GNAT family N-acetyltransferase [Firmicutes bacterium]|nr:GNAT family N-acetyltransferase [Bacillota bacterium]